MGGFKFSLKTGKISTAQDVWLRKVATKIFRGAKRKSTSGKSGSAQGAPEIEISFQGKRAIVEASKFHFGRPALDDEIRVPIGGFPPPAGEPNWKFIKPEGTVVIRARTYSRFSGQIIKKKGFMTEATEEELTSFTGSKNVQQLGSSIAKALVEEIVNDIIRDLNAAGIPARRVA